MMIEYLLILLTILAITIVLEKTHHIHLYHNRRERAEVVGLFFIIGVLWDSFAIFRGHWVFPPGKNVGITIGLMPLEEYLFIFIIPYFILTTYKIIDGSIRGKRR